ncbi:glycoprotein-N-acetylgalactosamine 3-beta-galactosyltransferase 1-like [Neocloeon triangulifer]|uniref:glycoprotein-N-acetylgalactosamine 3-beta-galactosyltransferase 1-like n=1 Tax=Neocloeon triangulifer TaxID=2078957 RepID=UPI00286F206C|nr:glycoprotein-N-acetylgalactosamine 3-beta-galactosyltransferase 1-like [Neocloeon triangulifer]
MSIFSSEKAIFLLGIMIGSFTSTAFYTNCFWLFGENERMLNKLKTDKQKVATIARKDVEVNLKKLEHAATNIKVQQLSNHQRLFCWVMTHQNNHQTKASTVRATWGRFCDTILFISDGPQDINFPIVHVDAPNGRSGLWHKVRAAFRLIHEKHANKFDWVLKADDDTFVNVNSLKQLLASYNPEHALFFGEPLIGHGSESEYMGGGSGYILSKETLKRFIRLLDDPRSDGQVGCDRNSATSGEDPLIARCLYMLNVTGVDGRDWTGMNRFSQHSGPTRGGGWIQEDFWYKRFQKYTSTMKNYNLGCCSSVYISYHYVQPPMMHQFQYLTFKVNPIDTSSVVRRA